MWFHSSFIVDWTVKALFIPLNILSFYFLLRGHHLPGGGFIAGLTSALSFLLIALTQTLSVFSLKWKSSFRHLAQYGMLIAILSCSASLLIENHFLDHLWFKLYLFGIEFSLGTALFFDLGVMLLVIGVTVGFILEFEGTETTSPISNRDEKATAQPTDKEKL